MSVSENMQKSWGPYNRRERCGCRKTCNTTFTQSYFDIHDTTTINDTTFVTGHTITSGIVNDTADVTCMVGL